MLRIRLQIAAIILLALIGPSAVHAQSPDLDALVKQSPFGSAPSPNAGSAATAVTPLEFRGVFVDAGEMFFSLHDVAAKRSLWVGLDEPGQPFRVRSYDEAADSVVVEYEGRTLTVALKQARVMTLPAPQVVPAAPGNVPPPSAQVTAQASATPPDEATRLAQIAEEIRRRRAIRAQMLQNSSGQQPAAPQPGPPASPGNRP